MRFSLRTKLVALLAAVAVVPLIIFLVTAVVVGGRMQRESFGKRMRVLAFSQGTVLRISLLKDIEKLLQATQGPTVLSSMHLAGPRLSPDDRKRLDAAWPTLPLSSDWMVKVLENPTVEKLKLLQQADPRLREILVTDRFGQLIAATGRTTDYYQGDEQWWLKTYNDGVGKVYLPPIHYDDSSGAWSLALCVPVALEGRTAGVCKAVLDMSGWIENVDRVVASMGAVAILVRDDGKIIYRRDIEPLTKTMKLWGGQIADAKVSGWRIAGNDIQAFAPIKLPQKLGHLETEMPNWLLVLHLPEKQALGAVYQVSVVMLIVGLVVILLIFLGGLWLIDRSVTRRIRRMAQAARSVARGDLAHRIQPDWAGRRLLGRDEIDRLAADFNEMVDRVQQSHEALKSANELKMNFIRIAGHELRTPVSYILGVGKLLRYSTSPEKLLHALQTVSARAKRLDEIIKAMFKIMPDQRYSAELRYGAVNVSELMEEVYIDMFPFVERRSQRLIVNCPKNLPTIQADLEKLRDIIENLIMNAIKFTPDGADIEVTLGKRLGGYLSIAVRDRGPGVPEGDLPNIFEPFYGGGDVMKHSTGAVGYQKRGMGLGLTIVRHFVELHHGTVNVTTGPDGATFTVVIPVEPPPPESRPLKP